MPVDVCLDCIAFLVLEQGLCKGGLVGDIILCRIAVPSSENRAGERLSLVGFEPYDGADTDFVRRRRIEIENIRRGNIAQPACAQCQAGRGAQALKDAFRLAA